MVNLKVKNHLGSSSFFSFETPIKFQITLKVNFYRENSRTGYSIEGP